MTDGGLLAAGWAAVRANSPAEAERLARTLLAADPDDAQSWFLLGIATHCQGRPAEAANAYERALAFHPDSPEILSNLGNALLDLGRAVPAEACFRHLLHLRPDDVTARMNLGNALQAQGHPVEAEACFRKALAQRPDTAELHYNLGNALGDQKRSAESADCFRAALRLQPDYADAHNNLGSALRDLGRLTEAEDCFRHALRLRPDFVEAHYNLGNTLRARGRAGEAAECYRRSLDLRPDWPEALNGLGAALREFGQFSAAEDCLRRSLALRPDDPEVFNILGVLLRDQGRVDEAANCYRRALALWPGYVEAHDGLLYTLHYQAEVAPEEWANEHAEFQRRHAEPLRSSWQPHTNNRDPDRPLRLGFVSPDFGRHPVGYLFVRGAEALARRHCTTHYYSNRFAAPDALTSRFQSAAHVWREVVGLSDDALAELVRDDGIDLLIDLAGHTAGNRLLAFARKPAPMQCTWLGYEGATGLEAIDFLIADERVVPIGAEDHNYNRILRLPGGYASYDPPVDAPEPGLPPVLSTGRVTFGCFNNLAKLSPPTLAAFADVLRRVTGSRLVLMYHGLDDPRAAAWLRECLAAAGAETLLQHVHCAPSEVFVVGHPGMNRLHGRLDLVYDEWLYPVFEAIGLAQPRAIWLRPILTADKIRFVVNTRAEPQLDGIGQSLPALGYVRKYHVGPFFAWENRVYIKAKR